MSRDDPSRLQYINLAKVTTQMMVNLRKVSFIQNRREVCCTVILPPMGSLRETRHNDNACLAQDDFSYYKSGSNFTTIHNKKM